MHLFFMPEQKNKMTNKSNGGRVLGVTALGSSLEDAINNAHDACNHIHWTNKYHRTDIGKKAI